MHACLHRSVTQKIRNILLSIVKADMFNLDLFFVFI